MIADDAIRAALAEALAGHRPSISGRAVCTCGRGQDFGAHLAAESLPTVRRLMQQQAAEELRSLAEDPDWYPAGRAVLNRRAAALAPETAP